MLKLTYILERQDVNVEIHQLDYVEIKAFRDLLSRLAKHQEVYSKPKMIRRLQKIVIQTISFNTSANAREEGRKEGTF